jgi:hypothetical protein
VRNLYTDQRCDNHNEWHRVASCPSSTETLHFNSVPSGVRARQRVRRPAALFDMEMTHASNLALMTRMFVLDKPVVSVSGVLALITTEPGGAWNVHDTLDLNFVGSKACP